MIEDRHWLFAGPTIWSPQAATEYLCDQELTIESLLLVRDDLEDILYIPALVQHRHRNDPFDLARFRIVD